MGSHYQLVRVLSEGAFGRVYLATDRESGRHVAVKELKQLDASSRTRFARELRLLKEQIDNEFVVDVLDANLDANPPFIVMEYCDGGSLRSWVGERPADRQPWQIVAQALGHVAQGLAGIHKAGGFHRDIKPDNLLLAQVNDEGSIVKVADFGLARWPDSTTGTMTYSPGGTRGYIAPEIRMGADFHSGADVFSLGVVALELLTGTNDPDAIHRCSAPDQLKAIVRQMLSNAAAKRPNLQRIATVLENTLAPPPPHKPAMPPPTVSPDSSGKRVALAVGVGVGLLALVGGLAYLAANAPEWDESVQRNRRKDGRFRSG